MDIIPERKTKNLTEYAMVHKNVQQARQRASTALTRHRDRWRTKIMKLTNQKTAYPAWQNFNRFTKQEKFVESVPPNEFETLIPRYSENCFLASKALDDKNFFPFKPYVKPIATNSTLTLIGSRENDVFEKLSELSFVLNSQNLVRLIGTGPLKKRSTLSSSADCRKKNHMFQELEASVQEAQKLQEEEEKNMDVSKLHNKIKLNGQLNICKNSPEKNAEFKVSPQTSPRKQKIRTPSMMQKNNPITFNVSQFVSQIKRASAEGTRGQISIEDYDGCLAPSVGIGQIQCKQKANKYRRGKIQKKRRAPKWVYFTPTTCVVRPSRSAKIQVSTVKHVQSRRRKRKAALKGYPLDFVRSVVSCFPRKRIFTKGKVKYEKATPLDISYLKTKRLKPSNARKLQKDKFSCFTACGWYRAQLRNLASRTKPVALPPYDKKKEKFDPYRRRLIPKCQYKPIPMPVDFKIPLTPKWNMPVPSNYEEIRQNYTKYMHKRHDIRIRKEYNFHWNEYIEPRQTKYQDTQFRKPELYSPVS